MWTIGRNICGNIVRQFTGAEDKTKRVSHEMYCKE